MNEYLLLAGIWILVLSVFRQRPDSLKEKGISFTTNLLQRTTTFWLGLFLIGVFALTDSYQDLPLDAIFALNNQMSFSIFTIIQFFSSIFVHFNLTHLVSNLFLLGVLSVYEKRVGSARFFKIFFASALLANLSILFYTKPILSAGASGGIAGLVAGYFLDYKKASTKEYLIGLAVALFAFFALQINSMLGDQDHGLNIDYLGHFLGFISGIIIVKLFPQKNILHNDQDSEGCVKKSSWQITNIIPSTRVVTFLKYIAILIVSGLCLAILYTTIVQDESLEGKAGEFETINTVSYKAFIDGVHWYKYTNGAYGYEISYPEGVELTRSSVVYKHSDIPNSEKDFIVVLNLEDQYQSHVVAVGTNLNFTAKTQEELYEYYDTVGINDLIKQGRSTNHNITRNDFLMEKITFQGRDAISITDPIAYRIITFNSKGEIFFVNAQKYNGSLETEKDRNTRAIMETFRILN